MSKIIKLFPPDESKIIISKTIQIGQNKWIMAFDDVDKYVIEQKEGYLILKMGQYHKVENMQFQKQIFYKLLEKGWDFENYDNPNLLLVTKFKKPQCLKHPSLNQ